MDLLIVAQEWDRFINNRRDEMIFYTDAKTYRDGSRNGLRFSSGGLGFVQIFHF